ncbi:MAG: FHA domain-containing protein [Betaproteobacteria bacterium]|jgi:predicted component of type VI protein secretion system|nr:FHA domain-containing protein [Betaproteobacteria bacterium]
MAASLRVVGPNFSVLCPINPAGAEIIVGRDPSCHVVLPDPKRNVSRRHLSVWVQGNRVFFKVISTVAGVTTSLRKYAPGESGELQMGHFLKFSDYTLNTEDSPSSHSNLVSTLTKSDIGSAVPSDPWAEMDSQWAGQGPQTMAEFPASPLEPDPFAEWSLESPNAQSQVSNPSQAPRQESRNSLHALLFGMGVTPSTLNHLNDKDLQALGKRVRVIVQAILTLEAAMEATQAKLGLKHNGQSNPLIGNQSPSQKLGFLLSTAQHTEGTLNPDDALNDLIMRLHAHEAAMMAATRATAMGILTDLEPSTIKASFDKSGTYLPMLASGKLWEFFCEHHKRIAANLPRWLSDVISQHFAPYYAREYDKNRK